MKRIIETPDAPAAVGPYSQGVIAGGLLFVAGQVALVPGEGKKLDNESIAAETHRVMGNVAAILGAAGCHFADVVHVRVYITSSDLFPLVNEAYAQYFPDGQEPTRECVVAQPPLEGAHVEVGVTALVPDLVS